MTEKQPGGPIYDEADLQRGADVARKVNESDGPLQFDAAEAESLRVILTGLQRALSIAQQTNYGIAAALYRKHLQIVHHESDDGKTFTVDLIVKPPEDTKPTVN